MKPKLIGKFQTNYGMGMVYLSAYCYDPKFPAIVINSLHGEPIATLTVYIEGVVLQDGELLVKTWSENERIAQQALESGLFEDTGKRVPTGFVEAQVWRFADKGER